MILLGDRSDIAQGLRKLLEQDDWSVIGWHRDEYLSKYHNGWDVILCALGTVAPVGWWEEQSALEWDYSIKSNLLLPLRLIRKVWPDRSNSAQVCMMAGSNPNTIASGYSAYNVGKMALLKAVEHLNEETDAKWFALAPGIVLTKIHQPTLEKNWPNERLRQARQGGGVPIENIYECLKWCLEQPKEKIGGRNICVSDPYRDKKFGPDTYKLRRYEG